MRDPKTLILAAGMTIILAVGVSGQPIIDHAAMPTPKQTVTIDLDNDGAPEMASAYALNDRYDIVTIRRGETGDQNGGQNGGDRDFDAAFIVPINLSDFDSLDALPNGNLRVTWGCFACGRYHSQTSVIVDARDGALLVIGYDDSYADRIYAAVMTCSVNLLTGDAIVESIGVDSQTLRTDQRAFAVHDLFDDTLPQVCQTGYARYDEDFLIENYPDN